MKVLKHVEFTSRKLKVQSIQLFLPLLRQWICQPTHPSRRLVFFVACSMAQNLCAKEAYFVTISLPVLQFFGSNKTTWNHRQHEVFRMKMQVYAACKFCCKSFKHFRRLANLRSQHNRQQSCNLVEAYEGRHPCEDILVKMDSFSQNV